MLPVGATTPQLTQALAADKGLKAAEMDEATGWQALATGNILLLAVQEPDAVVYRYDDTNPDARTARLLVDRAVEAAAGRQEAVRTQNELVHETGSRYIDCRRASKETAETDGRVAYAALAVSDGVSFVAAVHAGD